MEDKRLSLADAAKLVGCSAVALRAAARNKQLPSAEKYGETWTVLLSDAQAWWTREKHAGGRPRKTSLTK